MGDPTDRKSKFENTSPGVLGAVQFNMEGKPVGVPVAYQGVIWLSEEEQILTAQAPRNESDNPFLNGLKLLERGSEMERSRPIGEDQSAPGEPAPEDEAEGDEPPAAPPETEPVVAADADPAGGHLSEMRQERPPQPPPPAPGPTSGAGGGAQVVEPAAPPPAPAEPRQQVKSAMRPSSSPAAAAPPPAAAPKAAD